MPSLVQSGHYKLCRYSFFPLLLSYSIITLNWTSMYSVEAKTLNDAISEKIARVMVDDPEPRVTGPPEMPIRMDPGPVHHRVRRFTFPGWKQDTTKSGFTAEEKIALLDIHNMVRRETLAKNMRFLAWDDELETESQAWSATCDFKHNYNNDYGENLAAQGWYFNETMVVLGWFSEGLYYNYDTNSCDSGHTCGHYTQTVLAESHMMGCGITFCPSMKTISMTNGYFTVCNYDPAMNKGSSVPYERASEAEQCSNCPDDMPRCENKLCHFKLATAAPITAAPTTAASITAAPTTAAPTTTSPTTAAPTTAAPTTAAPTTATPEDPNCPIWVYQMMELTESIKNRGMMKFLERLLAPYMVSCLEHPAYDGGIQGLSGK